MPLDLSRLDADQYAAVTAPDGPVLVFAGAGSGKTRTLTARIAWLVMERSVPGREIMAVTFTRKAAEEMRERLRRLGATVPGYPFAGLRVGTFHAQLAMALRAESAETLARLSRTPSFTVWDEDDRGRAINSIIRSREIVTINGRLAAEAISRAKNDDLARAAFESRAETAEARIIASVWRDYEGLSARSNALDFDDILMLPARLLREDPEVRARWSGGLRHLLVDEFQDTNTVQLHLIELLTSVHGNVFVVGDDAQSIYRWRGARVENILSFRDDHATSTVVMLDTDYRSTQPICDLANTVLAGSRINIHKTLHASSRTAPGGLRPVFRALTDETAEARFVVAQVMRLLEVGLSGAEIAILLRQSSLSRSIEAELLRAGIDYAVLGGPRFTEREEIRDLFAYLRCLVNPHDALAFRRALAKPSGRGIGDKLIEAIAGATAGGASWPEAIDRLTTGDTGTAKGRGGLRSFLANLDDWTRALVHTAIPQLIDQIAQDSGLLDAYADGTHEGQGKVENLREAGAAAAGFGPGQLISFLETFTLDAHLKPSGQDTPRVSVATIHAAKGLEWQAVFLAGAEEGLLPHARSTSLDEVEEERRLLYVAITRAKRHLVITAARNRATFGGSREPRVVSRFLANTQRILDGYDPKVHLNGGRPLPGGLSVPGRVPGRPGGSFGRSPLVRRP